MSKQNEGSLPHPDASIVIEGTPSPYHQGEGNEVIGHDIGPVLENLQVDDLGFIIVLSKSQCKKLKKNQGILLCAIKAYAQDGTQSIS